MIITSERQETMADTSTNADRGLQQATRCARICQAFRGTETVVLDLREITPIFDFFVMTTGTNRRQMHAIAEEVDSVLENLGSARKGIEGYRESSWIVQDYGDIVLHVFTEESRELYDLEGLWADAPQIDWESLAEPYQPSEKQLKRQYFSTVAPDESAAFEEALEAASADDAELDDYVEDEELEIVNEDDQPDLPSGN